MPGYTITPPNPVCIGVGGGGVTITEKLQKSVGKVLVMTLSHDV